MRWSLKCLLTSDDTDESLTSDETTLASAHEGSDDGRVAGRKGQLKFGTKILTMGVVDVLDWFSLVVRLGLVSLA